ncbi:MAG: hypothetical protein DRN95_05670, partial [Candidatus Hydrothermarchaeota archaeon]
ESEKTLNILENSRIKELLSFLKFLYSPIDDLSFASFLLGDILSKVSGLSQREIGNFLFSIHQQSSFREEALYRLFRKSFPDVWSNYIEDLFRSVGFVSPYELVVGIYQRLRIMEFFPEEQGFFMKFLDLIKEKEEEYVELGEFLFYLDAAPKDDLYVNVSYSNSVKILTIHKSKGLEFPIVIIPFLRIDINPETGGKGTSSFIEKEEAEELGLLRITKDYKKYSPFLARIYARAYKKACIDELNNLYVALTRAKYELYIFIPEKSSGSKNKALYLIPQNLKEKGRQIVYSHSNKEKKVPLISIPSSLYSDWIKMLREEFGDISRIRNRQSILEGNIMHFILSLITNCYGNDVEKMVEEAVQRATAVYSGIEDVSYYVKWVKELIFKEEIRQVFFVSDGSVYCEKEIVNQFGDLKRIDRLVVKNNEVWIVDYKRSADNDGEYERQVQEYIEIMKEIYPQRKIRGFLIFLDKLVMKEVCVKK